MNGFKEAKSQVLRALAEGSYQHELRGAIERKNLFYTGQVSANEVAEILVKCTGRDHVQTPHHLVPSLPVHVFKKQGWYIKFYKLDPDVMFISVHR
ncbi:MAG TPA: hypothetical protein DE045_12625 [Oceanospirillaceae bacterium]|nr:hypothetical protein [Oceanospirillaceae bacterium]